MRQVLDDFLGVLCLACSRFTPKRVEGVLGKMRLCPRPPPLTACPAVYHSALLWVPVRSQQEERGTANQM